MAKEESGGKFPHLDNSVDKGENEEKPNKKGEGGKENGGEDRKKRIKERKGKRKKKKMGFRFSLRSTGIRPRFSSEQKVKSVHTTGLCVVPKSRSFVKL